MMQTDMNALNLRSSLSTVPVREKAVTDIGPSTSESRRRSDDLMRKLENETVPREDSRGHEVSGTERRREEVAQAVVQRNRVSCRNSSEAQTHRREQSDEATGKSTFKETYNRIASSNATAARRASEQASDTHENSTEKPVDAIVENTVIPDEPVDTNAEDSKLKKLMAKFGVDSVEGLLELLQKQTPDAGLLEELQQITGLGGELDISAINGIDASGALISGSEQVKKEAWVIIRQSLTVISQTFQLNIADQQMQDMEIGNPDQYVIKQFSEILNALKSLAQILGSASDDNVALDMQGQVIEPAQAADLEKTVRFEAMRLQIAFKMIGVSGEVNNLAAELENAPVYNGIPQAVDPLTVSQPTLQIRDLFSNLIENTEGQINAVLTRITAMAKELGLDTKGKIEVQNLKTNPVAQGTKLFDLSNLEALLLGKGVKVGSEVANVSLSQNAAGQPVSESLPVAPAASTFTSMFYRQSVQEMLSVTSQLQGSDGVAGAESAAKSMLLQPQTPEVGARAGVLPSFRTWEESVMAQITERLNHAVKNGVTEIRIQLKPESLGEIQLKIKVDGDVVAAKINVESQQVRQIVENNLQSLKNALAEHNLQAGAFDVNVGGERADRSSTNGNRRHFGGVEGVDVTAEAQAAGPADVAIGDETGRRYGQNTVEYFA